MFSKFIKIFSLLSFAFLFSLLTLYQAPVFADNDNNYGLEEAAEEVGAYNTDIEDNFLVGKIGSLVGAALSFVGVIFLIIIIYAGINWMTAGGNETKVTKSKNLLINASIGLIIVLAAYAITMFIGDFLIND